MIASRPLLRLYALLLLASGLAAAPAAAQIRQPVRGTESWLLSDRLPGVEQRACTARITGPDANMTLLLNNDGLPLLTIAHAGWDNNSVDIGIGVSIDAAAPVQLRGSAVANLVLVLIRDPALLARLRGAHMLEWTFPFGRFRTNATGFGTALDAVRACHNAAPAGG